MVSHPVYLDYAATSAVRPDEVTASVARYLRDTGATPGRAGHRLSIEAGRIALRCRIALAELLGIPGDPGRIAFQLNATHALNTALFGLLEPGDRVVRTRYDHNAVRRPVAALRARGVRESVLSGSAAGNLDLDEVERVLAGDEPGLAGRPAKLLVVPHASNVLDSVLPLGALAERARAVGALLLVDAAQTAGHLPMSVGDLGVDLLALTGHKGLMGPQGTGALWVREGIRLEPLLHGGTGGDSWPDRMPESYPDHLEAGTQNGPGLAGLLAGAEWLLERGVGSLHAEIGRLKVRFLERLRSLPNVRLLSLPSPGGVGILTLVAAEIVPAELAARLDREFRVMTRAGLHCAPETHQLLGTADQGAVRFSLGWASTEADVELACAALASITGNAARRSAVPIPEPSAPDDPARRPPRTR